MAITPIQVNILDKKVSFKNKKSTNYLEKNELIETSKNVKPLPPKGYLIKDNIGNSIKYFFKDMGYDIKAVKDAFQGKANDHQAGRLNDLGLKVGGVGIATYLASQTTNPKARLMEYIGLGIFLTSMSIYPKIAINGPARLKYGFDIDKEYIDDQGRKKSVFQDNNYVPFDMYLNRFKDEDLAIIGDKLGIPKDIKDRNNVVKEQMRKVATQNNTLWMLTAGFATPIMTALLCCGLENYVVAPAIEKSRTNKFNSLIKETLERTTNMKTNIATENELSKSVSEILSKHKGQELTQEAFDDIYEMLTKHLDSNISKGVKEDLLNILKNNTKEGTELLRLDSQSIKNFIEASKDAITGRNYDEVEKALIPTEEELASILKKFAKDENLNNGYTSINNISEIRLQLKEFFDKKLKSANISEKRLKAFENQRDNIIEAITESLKKDKVKVSTEESIEQITSLAKILGEFKTNQNILAKCKSFKFEQAPETTIARTYEKFEKAFIKELGFSFKELKNMRESSDYASKILDKKLIELCKDEVRYQKAMEKLGSIIAEMEINLHGINEQESFVKDLISAIENNYNNTAIRLNEVNANSFRQTIKRLVNQDVSALQNSLATREEALDFLDGIIRHKHTKDTKEYIEYRINGVGSSKNHEIMRIVERYQGSKNSLNRILHAFDVYKRSLNPETFAEALNGKSSAYKTSIIEKSRDVILKANAADHTLKLHSKNSPHYYKDLIRSIWAPVTDAEYGVKQRGALSESTQEGLSRAKNAKPSRLVERFQYYISKFRHIIGNNATDFTKPYHISDKTIASKFAPDSIIDSAFYNLVGQSPVEFIKGAADRRYSTLKWMRKVGTVAGATFGIALLAQIGFGKLSHKENLQKKAKNENI